MVCGEEKEKEVMFNKIVVENVEVGNGNKESTYRNRKTSIRTVLAGKCQVIDVGKFPATKSTNKNMLMGKQKRGNIKSPSFLLW